MVGAATNPADEGDGGDTGSVSVVSSISRKRKKDDEKLLDEARSVQEQAAESVGKVMPRTVNHIIDMMNKAGETIPSNSNEPTNSSVSCKEEAWIRAREFNEAFGKRCSTADDLKGESIRNDSTHVSVRCWHKFCKHRVKFVKKKGHGHWNLVKYIEHTCNSEDDQAWLTDPKQPKTAYSAKMLAPLVTDNGRSSCSTQELRNQLGPYLKRDTSIIGRNSLFRHVRKHARIIEDKMNRCQAGAIQAPESFVSSS